ncbi:multidrug DMT transporter permease [Streptomyces carminius]|uniref:Multidrug DMT transporter permease n=1 Tax=Streptomyces carminius TaxID=2665496 RepID=A0A2M8LZQ7_9ACTN|nr:EamA family transporter [Streptomyces carminius]PJE97434.1 multidrug DMT transporter permease [Streptomyces carminius]
MGALLALASAVCYGVVDFAGGLLSRRIHFAVVTFLGQVGGLFLALPLALLVPAERVGTADLLWGALSGVGSGGAMHFLNRGLSRGAMSVVVPVSAVTGVALSVLCGVCFLGDRPTVPAWSGIVLAVPALWLVSGGTGRRAGAARNAAGGAGRASTDGLIASAGVAVQYIGLAQADPASGLWAVFAGRVAAVLVLLPGTWRHAARFRQQPRLLGEAVLIGAGAALGLSLYLWATRQQMLAVAVVLASLYPAIPTILGLAVLHERLTRAQATGLLGATAATLLLTLG